MDRLLGVINLDKERDFLNELTYFRCGASVPFAGRYRLIDFTLANMINSGIIEIAVFVNQKYRSLLDHLKEPRRWNLDRKKGGLFILPPDWHDPNDVSVGDLRHFHNNMDFFQRGRAGNVVHCGSQHLCRIDFRDVYKKHLEKDADVTLVYKEVDKVKKEHKNCMRLDIDSRGKVLSINNKLDNKNIYMEIFIIKKDLLMNLVKDCIAYQKGYFFGDGIVANLDRLKVYAYPYQGYHGVVDSVENYYKNNMKLLNKKNYIDLFDKYTLLPTKVKDDAPARYVDTASVTNSIIADGCIIEGKVKNSIIFRNVHINKGSEVEDSVIMNLSNIGKRVSLKNVILDKRVYISEGQRLAGSWNKPYVIAKRQSI
ncbi:MAG: glucose-1-phosphate adenylyltransferase subunit GlgD [Halanaerobiaceae bacterium]